MLLQSNSIFESQVVLKNLPPDSSCLILEPAVFVEPVRRTRDVQGNGESLGSISPRIPLSYGLILPRFVHGLAHGCCCSSLQAGAAACSHHLQVSLVPGHRIVRRRGVGGFSCLTEADPFKSKRARRTEKMLEGT